jgi:hypothetical protein
MWKTGSWLRDFAVATSVAAALAQAPLAAGPRVGPVASKCPPALPERHPDADGKSDRCVARGDPTCPFGTELRSDVKGEADVCLPGSPAGLDEGKAPKCAEGFRLRKAPARDVCEKAAPPTCPSGFMLKAVKGEDQCHY